LIINSDADDNFMAAGMADNESRGTVLRLSVKACLEADGAGMAAEIVSGEDSEAGDWDLSSVTLATGCKREQPHKIAAAEN
jgi:hypothetical protein